MTKNILILLTLTTTLAHGMVSRPAAWNIEKVPACTLEFAHGIRLDFPRGVVDHRAFVDITINGEECTFPLPQQAYLAAEPDYSGQDNAGWKRLAHMRRLLGAACAQEIVQGRSPATEAAIRALIIRTESAARVYSWIVHECRNTIFVDRVEVKLSKEQILATAQNTIDYYDNTVSGCLLRPHPLYSVANDPEKYITYSVGKVTASHSTLQ